MVERFLLAVAALAAMACIGCSSGASAEAYNPANFQGTIDKSLPPDQQARQAAVQKLLNAMREGVADPGGLSLYAPGITLRERFDSFYGASKRLVRWDFNGPPRGGEVPVVLYFDDKDSGPVDPSAERKEERVYVVSGSGNRFSISRR